MKRPFVCLLIALCSMIACEITGAQSPAVVKNSVARGKVVVANPQSKVLTVLAESGRTMDFYGLDLARIEMSGARLGTLAELRPGMTVAVYYSSHDGHAYPQRILIPDANLAVLVSPLTPAENKALESKAANDGDITTNPGVKARIDKDITTQPGKKDPADPDITKKGN